MKTSNLLQLFIFTILTFSLSSCAVIEGIFKTGVGIGVFISVSAVILVLIIFFALKRRSK